MISALSSSGFARMASSAAVFVSVLPPVVTVIPFESTSIPLATKYASNALAVSGLVFRKRRHLPRVPALPAYWLLPHDTI